MTKCQKCEKPIRGPKLIVSGNYWCSECVYWADKEKERQENQLSLPLPESPEGKPPWA